MKELILVLGSLTYFIVISVPLAIFVLTIVYTIYFLKDLIHVGQQTKPYKALCKIFKDAFTSTSEGAKRTI